MMKPDDGYIAYIVNPKSGASSGEKLPGRHFEQYLKDKGFEVRASKTKSLEHACQLATNAAVDENCAMAVVVGGDGTVREVAHGLMGSNKPLLIVPGGTENLLANELGLEKTLPVLAKTFEEGSIRMFDLGNINGKFFTSITGFGFDGEVVKSVSSHRKGHIDYFDYFWPLWRTFWKYSFDPMTVEVDGEKIFDGRGLVFVGNISRYALGLNILGRANYGDGLLDICCYRCAGQMHLVKHSIMTIFQQHPRGRDVVYRQGKFIKVSSSNPDLPVEVDGDPGPALPAQITVVPNAVRLMVPEGAKPAGLRKQIMRALR